MVTNQQCTLCIHECKNQSNDICSRIKLKPDKKRVKYMNYLLVKKKIKLRKLCKCESLQLDTMKQMLRCKIDFNYKYLISLEKHINEYWNEEELEKYESRFIVD